MKNYTFIALLLTGLLFSCNSASENEDAEKADSGSEKAAASAGINKLSAVEFDALNKKYGDYVKLYKKFKENSQANKEKLSHYQTYNLRELIAKLEELESRDGAKGVRIYFGIYPDNSFGRSEESHNSDLSGWSNIIFVGTDESEVIIGKDTFTRRKDLISQSEGIFSVVDVAAFNEGTLCPPPKGCKKFGATLIDEIP